MLADFDFIVDKLENGVWDDRIRACRVLAGSNDPRAWAPLAGALRDREVDVRTAACRALDQLQDPRSVEPLMVLLEGETNAPLRRLTVEVLSRHKDERAIPVIARHLNDDDVEMRVAACQALGRLKAVAAVGALIDVLEDTSLFVRAAACETLGLLKQPRAIRPVIARLGDFEPAVRQKALEALRRLGEYRLVYAYSQAVLPANPDPSLLAHMAAHGDVRIVSPLIRRLEDGWLDDSTQERLIDILNELYRAAAPNLAAFYCTTDFARFEARSVYAPRAERIRYAGCRQCGSTLHVIAANTVCAVLDDRMTQPVRFNQGTLRVRWTAGRPIDFDAIEIGVATDEDVARLCVLAANDTDPFRRRLYERAVCYLTPAQTVSANTRQMLQRTFARVVE